MPAGENSNLLAGFLAADTASGQSASARVYDDLRQRIIDLDLPPDTVLVRNDLTAAYGVSQTPVREALQKLEQDGLVRIYPQSRTVVARINEQQLRESQFMRVAIETEVVRRLAAEHDEALLARIRSLVKMQEAVLDDPSQMQLFSSLDRAFHATLFDALNLQGLHTMLARRLGHLARCQALELPRTGKMQQIVEDHSAIVAGIAARDPEMAVDAMRRHLTGTITRIGVLRAEFPDYFSA